MDVDRRVDRARSGAVRRRVVVAGALVATLSTWAAAEWFVVCELDSGSVAVREDRGGERHAVMAGPLPGPRTATIWLEDNCPQSLCDAAGACVDRTAGIQGGGGGTGGWEVGELSSTTLSGAPPADGGRGAAAVIGGPTAVTGPGDADLTPLIETATAAAEACNFPAALASADHLTNFDPGHPWLARNHATLRRLAARQKAAEEAVWRASSLLGAGQLEQAHKAAFGAADAAVSCQSAAVSELVRGIDAALLQQRAARDAARRQAAAALLPGLVDLARVISGGQASGTPTTVADAFRSSAATQLLTTYGDPCAFQLQYRDPAVVTPTCSCTGYRFDVGSFRCVSP